MIGRRASTDDDDDDEPTPRPSTKKPVIGRRAATDDDDDDEPTPRPSTKKPVIGRRASTDDDDDDEPTPRPSTKKPVIGRRASTDDDDDDEPTPRPSTKKPVIGRRASTDDDDDDEPTPRPSTKKPVIGRRASTDDDDGLASFLRKHRLAGDEVLGILADSDVNSLSDFKMTREDPELFDELKQKLKGRRLVIRTLDKIPVEAIDNAIFYSQKPEREAEAETLADFLIQHDVLADGEESDKEKLLHLLRTGVRTGGVTSLSTLKSIKESGKSAQLTALTAKITQWSQEAGSSFESITFAMVAKASRGRPTEADEDLKQFIKKKGLPKGTEAELVEFGITSLNDLKDVKEDPTRLDELNAKLGKAGIPGATERIGRIKVADIKQEIAEAQLPDAADARRRSEQLANAIEKVEELRQEVEDGANVISDAVKSRVQTQYDSLLATIGDVSGAEFKRADAAALKSKQTLSSLLNATIADAKQARGILDGVVKQPRTVTTMIDKQAMLSGFLFTFGMPIRKNGTELIKLPDNAEDLLKDAPDTEDYSYRFNGQQVTSIAASTADECSRSIAVKTKLAGAAFVGTGIAAASVAAEYADSQKESRRNQESQTDTETSCGEILYKYAPKGVVQFDKNEIRLSDEAKTRLDAIVKLPPGQQTEKIKAFYREFGSHFFSRCILGGRYQFKATGTASTGTSKGELVSAVAKATQWAASASGSYAGVGGAVTAAAAVTGDKTEGSAAGNKFQKAYEDAVVTVTTKVTGGAQISGAPQDIWQQSLRYNSTWVVIDREDPIPVWELVKDNRYLNDDIKGLAAVLEEVWVRQVFLNAIEDSHPPFYKYLNKHTEIITAEKLDKAINKLDAPEPIEIAPQLDVVVVTATATATGKEEYVTAYARAPRQGLKLIGGGAIVEPPASGQPGNLLYASYPGPVEYNNAWTAAARSHKWSSLGTVRAYAIYLDDKDDSWDVKSVHAYGDGRSSNPEAQAILPPGYALTGGGGEVKNWVGAGVMLKESRPVQIQGEWRGWTIKGTDHVDSDTGVAEAWVIGIRPRNGAEIPKTNVRSVNIITDEEVHPRGVPWSRILLGPERPEEEVIVGGGARCGYDPPPPSLLTGSGLTRDNQKWCAEARTHGAPGTQTIEERQYVELEIWVISRKGRLVPA